MPAESLFGLNILRALRRARFGNLIVGMTYVLARGIGVAMVHGGNKFALGYVDRIVLKAWASSRLRELVQGHRVIAAALDLVGNSRGGLASS
jgi:hypothetical protein